MNRKQLLVASALFLTGSAFATLQTPAMAVDRHIKLASCAKGRDAAAAVGITNRNGKTAISLTANFFGDAGCDIRPLKNNGILARHLYEKPTTFLFDFNGNKPRSSFTLFVIVDYTTDGGTRLASTQVSFGDQNEIPLVKQADGTYLATVTEKSLIKNFIKPDDRITKFTLDYRNADNLQNQEFVNTIYVSGIKFAGDLLPIDLQTAKAGCEVFD